MTQSAQMIDLSKIVDRDSFNPRDEIEKTELERLSKSIERQGLLQPIIVRPLGDGYAMIDGHRRAAACVKAGIFQVLAIVHQDEGDESSDLVKAVTANQVRVDLNPVEEAKAYQRLKADGRSPRQIAAELALTEKLVKERLALLELPDEVLALVADGSVPLGSMAVLRDIAKVCPPAALEVAKNAAEFQRTAAQIIDAPLWNVQAKDAQDGWMVVQGVLPDCFTLGTDQNALIEEATKLRGYRPTLSLHKLLDEGLKVGTCWSTATGNAPVLVADLSWLSEGITRLLKADLRRAKEDLKNRIDSGQVTPPGVGADGEVLSDDEQKDARREQLKTERRDQANARGANHQLLAALYGKTKQKPLDRPLMLALAKLLIGPEYSQICDAGPAQCDERYLQHPEKENGAYDFDYTKARQDTWGFIAEGQNADEVLHRLMLVLAQAECSNLASLPQSRRVQRPALMSRAGELARWYCQEALPSDLRVRKLPAADLTPKPITEDDGTTDPERDA